jgi:Tol biopolymer transport system component
LAFSPDGRALVLREQRPNTGQDLRVFAAAGDRRVTDLVATSFTEENAEISPDGRWVAHEANPSGQMEIYVRPFPAVNQGQWQISTGGGTQPLWSRDGHELSYRHGYALMAVTIGGDPRTAGHPRQLFEGNYYPGAGGRAYDVAPDGTRFLMIKEAETQAARATITLVEHWRTQLERLLPTN